MDRIAYGKIILGITLILILSVSFAQAGVIVLTSSEPPANYMENGVVSGTSVDIVRELLRRVGIDAEIKMQPWARVYQSGLDYPNVILFTAGKTEKRVKAGFHFIGPVMTRNHTVYMCRGEKYEVSSIEDIKRNGMVVGGMRGDWRSELFASKGVKVDLALDSARHLKKLMGGRHQLLISSDMEIHQLLSNNDFPADSLEPVFVFAEAPSFIMISKGTPENLVEEMRQAFSDMQQTDFFERIAAKYSRILQYEIDYLPEKGFFISEKAGE